MDRLVEWRDLSSDETFTPMTDHRRSVVGTWNHEGMAVDEIGSYNAHGRLELKDAAEQTLCNEQATAKTVCENPSGTPFGFLSALRSETTGLVYLRNRWYSPRLGQFTSHDPLGYVDSYNPYAFVGMDPVNGWDPWGLKNTSFIWPGRSTTRSGEAVTGERSKPPEGVEKDLVRGAAKAAARDALDSYIFLGCGVLCMAADLAGHDVSEQIAPGLNPDNEWEEVGGHMQQAVSAGLAGAGGLSDDVGKAAKSGLRRVTGSTGSGNAAKKAKNTLAYCSFPAGTVVHMCDGSLQAIEDVEEGPGVGPRRRDRRRLVQAGGGPVSEPR